MLKLVSIKVDQNTYDVIKKHYSNFPLKTAKGEYEDFVTSLDGTVITGFLSKKNKKTITFNGDNALKEAQKWDPSATLFVPKKSLESKEWVNLQSQIGSDEVGVGDLFLPMIVVASYVDASQIERLKELGVSDSKKLTDETIRELGPILIKEFQYSKLTLSNKKYNEMYSKGENINSLKAKMHNRALANLLAKHNNCKNIFIDQFVSEPTYYSYFDKNDEPIVKGITFHTKGESYYPSVALSSVIARYAFLIEKDKLEEEYNLEFPFGAGSVADDFLLKIKEKLPREAIDNLVKANFKNYK